MCQKSLEAGSAQSGLQPAVAVIEERYRVQATRWTKENVDPNLQRLLAAGYALGVQRELHVTLPAPFGADSLALSGGFNGTNLQIRWSL
jgi:hypothetical protein